MLSLEKYKEKISIFLGNNFESKISLYYGYLQLFSYIIYFQTQNTK